MQVRLYDQIEQLDVLEADWQRLLATTPGADFFHTLDWLKAFWQHYGEDRQLQVLAVGPEHDLTGIVPLAIAQERTKLGSFRVLTYPMDYWGSFFMPIGLNPIELLSTTLAWLTAQSRRRWDFLELNWVPPEFDHFLPDIFERHGLPYQRRQLEQIPIADLSRGWDDYWQSRSGNTRSNCRRNEKKAAKLGKVEHIRYRPQGAAFDDGDPRWDLYEECERLAALSWQAASTDGTTLTHSHVRDYLRDTHESAAAAGGLDLNLLTIDGEAVAFHYCYYYGGYVSSLRLGFDPRLAKSGVGTVLTYCMLQDSCGRGDHTFDMLPGSLGVKRPWQTEVATSYRYAHFPAKLGRSQVLRLKRWLSHRMSPSESA